MKGTILTAILFLGASSAMAMPAVGDFANWAYTMDDGTQTATGDYSEKLTSYDAALQEYTMEVTQTQDGETQVQQSQMAESDLVTDAQLEEILTNCADYGGALEDVTVSSTDTVQTCKLGFSDADGSGVEWVGKTAFGLVKYDYTYSTGETESFSLTAYELGK